MVVVSVTLMMIQSNDRQLVLVRKYQACYYYVECAVVFVFQRLNLDSLFVWLGLFVVSS